MDTRHQRHVELICESGHKRVLTLEPGRDTGMWCLTEDAVLRPASPNVRGARLFLRFDGATFAIGTHPSTLFYLHPPASLASGELRIAYRLGPPPPDPDLGPDDATQVRLSPVPAGEEPTRVASHPPLDEWEEATRVAPPPDVSSLNAPGLVPGAPAAEASVAVRATVDATLANANDETAVGPPPKVPALRGGAERRPEARRGVGNEETRVEAPHHKVAAPPVAAKPKAGRITPIRIGIFAMMVTVFALVSAASALRRSAAPAGKPTAQVRAARPAPSSATPPSSGASARAVTAAEVHAAAPVGPSDSQTPPVARPPATESAPLAVAEGDGERAAVLAVESGAADRAAGLYDSLAASHPERPAYREAARILRAKATPR
jgi:hypothetical protein